MSYQDNQEEISELRDALEHIARTCKNSYQQTRRNRWIQNRAECALSGEDWRDFDAPKKRCSEIKKLKANNWRLRKELQEYFEGYGWESTEAILNETKAESVNQIKVEGINELIDYLRAVQDKTPLGDEDKTRGTSIYNWYSHFKSVARDFRDLIK